MGSGGEAPEENAAAGCATRSAAFLMPKIWLSKFLNRMSDGLERTVVAPPT